MRSWKLKFLPAVLIVVCMTLHAETDRGNSTDETDEIG